MGTQTGGRGFRPVKTGSLLKRWQYLQQLTRPPGEAPGLEWLLSFAAYMWCFLFFVFFFLLGRFYRMCCQVGAVVIQRLKVSAVTVNWNVLTANCFKEMLRCTMWEYACLVRLSEAQSRHLLQPWVSVHRNRWMLSTREEYLMWENLIEYIKYVGVYELYRELLVVKSPRQLEI